MALNVLSFSVSREQDSLLGVASLQPSWADQPWPYTFSVSPILDARFDSFPPAEPRRGVFRRGKVPGHEAGMHAGDAS